MKHISILIKPASGLCNINCRYCFYADITSLKEVKSCGKMSLELTDKLIFQVFKDLDANDRLSVIFQGGEPTLAGLSYFEHFIAEAKEYAEAQNVTINYSIQTNGMTITSKWCNFLKKNEFLVGLSIDGHGDYHDLYRVDGQGKGTFKRVLKTKRMFDHYEIPYNMLCVLSEQLAQAPEAVYHFLKEEKIEYVQFIPCLDELYPTNRNDYALIPKSFAAFYKKILDLWLIDFKNNQFISIKLFDDLYNLFVLKQVTSCGMLGNCQVQYVIEADGSVYPCDFYVIDEYKLGNIAEKTLRELFTTDVSSKFICEKKSPSSFCQSCELIELCQGGCKRMKDMMYVNSDNTECGYQTIVRYFTERLEQIIHCREKMIKTQKNNN